MIDRAVVITGPLRSGTSLVAQAVHRLGWQIAPMVPASAPPSWRSDYEDGALSVPLLRGSRPPVEELETYIAGRLAFSKATGFDGRIALKSPLLSLIWKRLLLAFGGWKPLVIRTYREDFGRRLSLAAHPALSADLDEQIRRALALDVTPDFEIGYEWATDDPERFAGTLAQHLGVDDHAAIRATAALVGSPTRYPNGIHARQGQGTVDGG